MVKNWTKFSKWNAEERTEIGEAVEEKQQLSFLLVVEKEASKTCNVRHKSKRDSKKATGYGKHSLEFRWFCIFCDDLELVIRHL